MYPTRYDYRGAAPDALHSAKLVDRWVQNLRRGAGYKAQHSSVVEPQRPLAPHLHTALRGAIPRQTVKGVTKGGTVLRRLMRDSRAPTDARQLASAGR